MGINQRTKLGLTIFVKNVKQEAVEIAKFDYLTNMGNKLNNPNTSQKSHWEIINKMINKSKDPKLPPLLVNNMFIFNCREKAKLFTDFFSQQCKPVINQSVLPNFNYLTNDKIENDDIISLIR